MISTAPNFQAIPRARSAPYALALVSIGGFSYFQETPLPLMLGILMVVISWLLVESPRGKPVPKIIINTVVVCATIFLWGELQPADRNFVAALGHFLMVLLLCKFFERKDIRNNYQTVIYSLLLMIASAMYSSSIIFACILAVFVALLVYSMILFRLQASILGWGNEGLQPSELPAHDTVMARDLRKIAFRCTLLLLPIAVAVFLLLPRTRTNSLFSHWGSGGGTFETGFSENIQFHDYGQLAQSDEVVMDVKLTRRGQNAGSEWFEPYFRGQVLDTYDFESRQWTASASGPANVNKLALDRGEGVVQPVEMHNPYLLIQEYTLYHTVARILFEVAPPVYIMSDRLHETWFNNRNITFNALGTESSPAEYIVASIPTFGSLLLDAPPILTPPMKGLAKEIPALARSIVQKDLPPSGQDPSPEQIHAIVTKLEGYLRTNYPYSLEFRQHDAALDPTVDFLLNRKDTGGHCEYFASAMVMLCRSVGLSARIVNGYTGSEFNTIGGYYVVRQKDSHSWAEIYIPGEGWLQSDPTPSATSVVFTDSFLTHWTGEMSQFIENLWQAAVVSFDNESRRSVMEWLKASLKGPREAVSDFYHAIAFSVRGPSASNWMRITLLGPPLGLVLISGWVFKRFHRERQQMARIGTFRKPVRLSGDTLFLDELLRLIVSDGPGSLAARLPHQTPHEFIEESVRFLGTALPDARWLVDTFYSIQFGATRPTAELKSQIAIALRRVKSALGQSSETAVVASQ